MPKNKVNDPITDQEMAFARLVLAGGMTDRQAAETTGLNPDSAAYTKSKPHVRAYMLEHRVAVQQHLAQLEAEALHRFSLDRQQVLFRLWEIAKMAPDMTRGSISGQVKALAMIVAMENFIPGHKAAVPRQETTTDAPEIHAPAWQEAEPGLTGSEPNPGAVGNALPVRAPVKTFHPGASALLNRFSGSETAPLRPLDPIFISAPHSRVPFSINGAARR